MPTSFTKETKSTTTYTKESKEISYLENEDASYLLLEDLGRIIISGLKTDYAKEAKP